MSQFKFEWAYCRCGSGHKKNKCLCGRRYRFKVREGIPTTTIWVFEVGTGIREKSEAAQ